MIIIILNIVPNLIVLHARIMKSDVVNVAARFRHVIACVHAYYKFVVTIWEAYVRCDWLRRLVGYLGLSTGHAELNKTPHRTMKSYHTQYSAYKER